MNYLSLEWIQAADDAVASIAVDQEPASIGYEISGSERTVSYTIAIGPGKVRILAGLISPGVVLSLSCELATEIAMSKTSAQRAFLDGAIRLRGDVRVLLDNSKTMAAIDAELAELRATTLYESHA